MRSNVFDLKVSADGQIELPLELVQFVQANGPVRVIALAAEQSDAEPTEEEWMQFLLNNPAYDFLKDPREDIYTIADGQSYDGER
ncbi:MAG: hypothetical protein M3Z04_23710 [Chloroflexota bacterium]|nr:hypothetical protein [Chloroflexota bacterium]